MRLAILTHGARRRKPGRTKADPWDCLIRYANGDTSARSIASLAYALGWSGDPVGVGRRRFERTAVRDARRKGVRKAVHELLCLFAEPGRDPQRDARAQATINEHLPHVRVALSYVTDFETGKEVYWDRFVREMGAPHFLDVAVNFLYESMGRRGRLLILPNPPPIRRCIAPNCERLFARSGKRRVCAAHSGFSLARVGEYHRRDVFVRRALRMPIRSLQRKIARRRDDGSFKTAVLIAIHKDRVARRTKSPTEYLRAFAARTNK